MRSREEDDGHGPERPAAIKFCRRRLKFGWFWRIIFELHLVHFCAL